MNEAEVKEKIFTEIRQSIKYLLREKDKGREKFENSDFFNKELEQEIVANFNNRISVTEYEEQVYALFGAQVPKKGRLSKGKIHNEVKKLIRQYRMRSKKQILQKLIGIMQPLPSEIEELRNLMTESYNSLMQEPLKIKITSLVRAGIKDLRGIVNTLRREKYEVEKEIVEQIFYSVLKDLEKTKAKYSRGKRKDMKIALDYSDDNSPVKKRLRAQMRKTLAKKAQYKKQTFIRKECPKVRFTLEKDAYENNLRVLVYSATTEDSEISVKTSLMNNRISDILITCRHKMAQQGSVISVVEFQKITGAEQKTAFVQRWLKNCVKQMHYENIQEVNWWFMSVLNDKFGLLPEVAKYLKTNFLNSISELDKTINKFLIEKALEQI